MHKAVLEKDFESDLVKTDPDAPQRYSATCFLFFIFRTKQKVIFCPKPHPHI